MLHYLHLNTAEQIDDQLLRPRKADVRITIVNKLWPLGGNAYFFTSGPLFFLCGPLLKKSDMGFFQKRAAFEKMRPPFGKTEAAGESQQLLTAVQVVQDKSQQRLTKTRAVQDKSQQRLTQVQVVQHFSGKDLLPKGRKQPPHPVTSCCGSDAGGAAERKCTPL